ncbi:MAG: hypothetical protein P0Y53_01675 [Candidatus Pseudobacter hemicellulosilyticus]|uniref:Uncharacterized protein n=1 Tax=Candidatus Pseudobacter hemicellulosilyticus TaxID=3121375 RepID=A0AAJ5WV49_9BACT|nr:MAG: hypothetical protein P0Y53_01675 [Pseudobacter sp.]
MATDFEDKMKDNRMQAYSNRRALMDIGMGIIYLVVGGFIALKDHLGTNIDFPSPPFSYIFGGLCLLYGGFRIYRGARKNYFQ